MPSEFVILSEIALLEQREVLEIDTTALRSLGHQSISHGEFHFEIGTRKIGDNFLLGFNIRLLRRSRNFNGRVKALAPGKQQFDLTSGNALRLCQHHGSLNDIPHFTYITWPPV